MTHEVAVVIGVGGMGEAVARRQGPGRHLLLADANGASLESVAASLKDDGYDVSAQLVDVGSRASVQELADSAAAAGALTQLVHTAGLSPMQASTEAILRVDLYGAALVMEVFGDLIAVGGAGVVIASMAGHLLGPLPAEQEKALMATPTDDLLSLDFVNGIAEPGLAYSIAKNANMLRVKAESLRWGRRRGRLNSISPGVISTPMGRQELDGDHGAGMRAMVGASGTGRVGTPADIVNATAFLLGPESSFITGTDLLVDGGVVAAVGVLK